MTQFSDSVRLKFKEDTEGWIESLCQTIEWIADGIDGYSADQLDEMIKSVDGLQPITELERFAAHIVDLLLRNQRLRESVKGLLISVGNDKPGKEDA
jgi:hypothetical protein